MERMMFDEEYLGGHGKEAFIPSILFVDDEQNVLRSIQRLFISEGYKMFFANNPEEGLEILKENPVHLVITDYRMPTTNGVDFLKKVREICPYTVRMILSGFADIRSIVDAINEGEIYKFIPKPWDNEDLRLTISAAVERYCLFEKNRELTQVIKEQNRELRRLNEELEESVISRTQDLVSQNKILSLSQQVINNLPLPVIALDSEGIVTIENNSAQDLTGRSFLHVKGSDFLSGQILESIKLVKEGDERQRECIGILFQGIKGRVIVTRFSTIDPEDSIILVFLLEKKINNNMDG